MDVLIRHTVGRIRCLQLQNPLSYAKVGDFWAEYGMHEEAGEAEFVSRCMQAMFYGCHLPQGLDAGCCSYQLQSSGRDMKGQAAWRLCPWQAREQKAPRIKGQLDYGIADRQEQLLI